MSGIGCDLTHISTLAEEVTTRGTDRGKPRAEIKKKKKGDFFHVGSKFPKTISSYSGTELKQIIP